MVRQLVDAALPWLKFVQPVLILLLLAAVVWQTNQLNHRNEQLGNEHKARAELSRSIGVSDDWASIRTGVNALKEWKAKFEEASRQAVINKNRADRLDADLSKQLSENAKLYAAHKPMIDALKNRKATGDKAKDDAQIEEDSKAAWDSWILRLPHAGHSATPRDVVAPIIVDQHNWVGPTHIHTHIDVKLVPYYTYDALEHEFITKRNGYKPRDGYVIKGFTTWDENTCYINMLDPLASQPDYQTLGHEMLHCFYGYWHGTKPR